MSVNLYNNERSTHLTGSISFRPRILRPTQHASGEPVLGDPLEIFPVELWLEIIQDYVAWNPDGVFVLTLLSKRWQAIILSTPSLWTGIAIKNAGDIFSRSAVYRELSQGLPLSLSFELPMEDALLEHGLHILDEEYHRVREIHFEDVDVIPESYDWMSESAIFAREQENINTILTRVKSLPALERIHNGRSSSTNRYTLLPSPLPEVPQLSSITGLLLENLQDINKLAIRCITINYNLLDIYPLFPQLPQLQSITLAGTASFPAEMNRAKFLTLPKEKVPNLLTFVSYPTIVSQNWGSNEGGK